MTAPLIVGLAGPELSAAEHDFLKRVRPLGVILFARNVAEGKVAALAAAAKEAAGSQLAFVDQEGGRVQRLRPPLAPRYPAPRHVGELFARDAAAGRRAAWLIGRLIGADLARYGLDSPCLPDADVPVPGAHDVIGDRAWGEGPDAVTQLAAEAAEGVFASGCLPVVKHMPGHGRAYVDSHLSLPEVDASLAELERDFAPFRALNALPMGMTAHVRFAAIDADAPATLSAAAVRLIREEIGFDGLLMTDDISMGALGGDVADNALRALDAGVDCVLHCNGKMDEMERIAAILPAMTEGAAGRLAAVHAARRPADGADIAALHAEFADLMGMSASA